METEPPRRGDVAAAAWARGTPALAAPLNIRTRGTLTPRHFPDFSSTAPALR
ncbi:hypothetical protein PLANPX_5666 [Lacipirellula parvula]|uniref:Uncharacterized protein n=1 Tax=Lacipirellula parvula TaxID=2650471 RepID=A0A5K7XGM9_9BACT|nr:hypothetical protein PLANPX_5666 [Lacipirellula parvula]